MFGLAIFSRLLGFLPFRNILKGVTGKLILVSLIFISIGFIYWKFKDNIKTSVYDEIFREQVETHLNEQQREINRLKKINQERDRIINDLIDKQRKILDRYSEISNKIESGDLEDGPVSPVLKHALDSLEPAETTGNSVIDEWINDDE